MAYLIFDTETTGLPFSNLPFDDWRQPRIVQFAGLLVDAAGRESMVVDTLIRPDGWAVPPEMTEVHGWTTEDCDFMGIPMVEVIDDLAGRLHDIEAVVAHHVEFDLTMFDIECANYGRDNPLRRVPAICTMKTATPVLRLPGGPRGTFKYPSLEEAVESVLGREATNAHDALADAKDCKDLFLSFARHGIIAINSLIDKQAGEHKYGNCFDH
jgi:DNA polymerase-3 subunit epsilon